MALADSRRYVLSLYRKIFRLARTWQALEPAETPVERQYIRDEARRLFRRGEKDTEEITAQQLSERIVEAEARIEMALHYRNPYPRFSNVPPFTVTPGRGRHESQARRIRSTPAHLNSYKDET